MQTLVGVKIPKAGCLDPHPQSFMVGVRLSLGLSNSQTKLYNILPIQLKVNLLFIGMRVGCVFLRKNFKMQTWVGVKISRAGYLDPTPYHITLIT